MVPGTHSFLGGARALAEWGTKYTAHAGNFVNDCSQFNMESMRLEKYYPMNFGLCLENRTVNTTQSSPSLISRISKSPSPVCLRFSASCSASSSSPYTSAENHPSGHSR